jgi:hypothetical protein
MSIKDTNTLGVLRALAVKYKIITGNGTRVVNNLVE